VQKETEDIRAGPVVMREEQQHTLRMLEEMLNRWIKLSGRPM
jgi:hypothetical protein